MAPSGAVFSYKAKPLKSSDQAGFWPICAIKTGNSAYRRTQRRPGRAQSLASRGGSGYHRENRARSAASAAGDASPLSSMTRLRSGDTICAAAYK